MAEIWLLCEGASDAPVLTEVFTKVLASGITIEPTGGSSNAASAAAYIDEAVIADGLRSCAVTRAPQEAGRIAMVRLWEGLSDTAGRIQKRIPAALSTDSLDAAVCRGAFLDEAARIVAIGQMEHA